MAKEPFTPDGVKDKLDAIYALPTIDRMAEATAIETGFKSWVSDNFLLDTTQTTFLTGMNSTVTSDYGKNCAIAFRHLKAIALIAPTPKPGTSKWVVLRNDLVLGTNGSGTEEVTGSLTFEIEYR